MAREIELKYVPNGEFSKEKLFALSYIRENMGQTRTISMRTEYLDTAGRKAKRLGITLRRRIENGESVFYAKTSLARSGAFSERGEWSVCCDDPALAVQSLCDVGAPCSEFVGEELFPVATVSFTRVEADVTLGELSFILSYDEGHFNDNIPFSELELELVRGRAEDLLIVGDKMKRELNLKDEPRSKYARALLYK